MRLKTFLPFITLISCAFLVSSFTEGKKKKFKAPKSFAYIPSGKLTLKTKEKFSIQGFYIQETEVSNKEYNEFLNDLKQKRLLDEYEIAKHTPENWQKYRPPSYGEPYSNNYHHHPAYDDYPVLTISKEGAELYCKWLEEKWSKKNPEFKVMVKIPTEKEWMYAAKGGHELAPFPWGGYYYRNGKGKILANFRRLSGLNIKFNTTTKQYEVVNIDPPVKHLMPAPVKSFLPNDYGLYHISGNAAEMVAEPNRTKGGSYYSTAYHIQIEAEDEYEGWTEPSPFIGFRPLMQVSPK